MVAREAITHFCTTDIYITGTTCVRFLPVADDRHPVWRHRILTLQGPTQTVISPTLDVTARYLLALDRYVRTLTELCSDEERTRGPCDSSDACDREGITEDAHFRGQEEIRKHVSTIQYGGGRNQERERFEPLMSR